MATVLNPRIHAAKLFADILPSSAVLKDPEELHVYECDALSAYRTLPLLVLLPETVNQVQRILQVCSEHSIPVIARGAGTGLSGGATPREDAVIVSLARFNKILKIDVDNRLAVVQPGVRNLAISESVRPHHLYYAPDPSSQIACSIGGNVAENSGGVHCLKYGLTVHNVLGLKLITPDGELLELGGATLDAMGYDLLALITGSEGLLGLIVEITVKLLPIPESARVILAAFDSLEKAGLAVAAVMKSGITPAGLEMMDRLSIQAAEAYAHAGYPLDAEAILLCEVDGTSAEVDEHTERLAVLLEQCGAFSVHIAANAEERARFWKGRKSAFPAVGRISPDYYCMDGTIPRKHLAYVLAEIRTLSEQFQLRVANVFHAGDGNLHPLILYDANKPGELARVEEFGGRILELCLKVGGTITGEHGVGIEKIDHMCLQFSRAELQFFHAVKQAFDPHGLLNPGKAIPTLQRCAEFGAMHVHAGQVAFPDLERF